MTSNAGSGARAATRRLPPLANRAGRWLVDRLLPRDCVLCDAATAGPSVCTGCATDLPPLPPLCPQCAMPSALAERCGACVRTPPPFTRTLVVATYAFPFDRLVQGLKFDHRLPLAAFLAERLSLAVTQAGTAAELVLPMPLARARLRERGFNQSVEIGRRVAARLDRPFAVDAARRIRDTRPQIELPPPRRIANVRGAFAAGPDVLGRHVAVVDDVMTTGASLAELSRTLLAAGALSVECWVVARAFGHESTQH